jgi:aryl-alcohol dehydrogenase-like predicted oxidoreductase
VGSRDRPTAIAPDRFVLGTAQLGFAYGITNAHGALSAEDARAIVDAALASGVDRFDTAPAYGASESVLGDCLGGRGKVVSKTPSFPDEAVLGSSHAEQVRASARRSIDLLGRPLHGLLVHHAPDLWKPGAEHLVRVLRDLMDRGDVERVGVSVYEPAEVTRAMEVLQPSVVQLPLSVLDQRFVEAGTIAELAAADVEVHVRSIFLQGLLLDASALPASLAAESPALAQRFAALDDVGSRLASCLAFIADQSGVRRVVIGVTDAAELAAILEAAQALPPRDGMRWDALAMHGPLIDPRRWA